MFAKVFSAVRASLIWVYASLAAAWECFAAPPRGPQAIGDRVSLSPSAHAEDPEPSPSSNASEPLPEKPRKKSTWLRRVCSECEPLDLTADELEYLLMARQEFSAALPTVVKLLHRGATALDIYHFYRVRHEVNEEYSRSGVSVEVIHRYTETFASAEPDRPDLAGEIVAVVDAIQADVRWVRTFNQAIHLACRVGRDYGLADSRVCLDWIRINRNRRRSSRLAQAFRQEVALA